MRLVCQWCGKKLVQNYTHPDYTEFYNQKNRNWNSYREWLLANRKPTGTYGYGGTNLFCKQSCGYQWAVSYFRSKGQVPKPTDEDSKKTKKWPAGSPAGPQSGS